jgi:hypothetical protein
VEGRVSQTQGKRTCLQWLYKVEVGHMHERKGKGYAAAKGVLSSTKTDLILMLEHHEQSILCALG